MRRFYSFLVSLLAGGLVFAAGAPAQTQSCSEQNAYFPLTPGASWTYKSTHTDINGPVNCNITRHFTPSAAPGKSASIAGELQEDMSCVAAKYGSNWRSLLGALVEVRKGAVYGETKWCKGWAGGKPIQTPPCEEKSFGLVWPELSALLSGTIPAGQYGSLFGHGTNFGSGASKTEQITVPAGTFTARKFVGSVGPVTVTVWYAPWVGMVKWTQLGPNFSTVQELVNYSVTPSPCCEFTVTSAEGDVTVDGKPANAGARFTSSSTVKTGKQSRVSLAMGDGSIMRIGDNSEFAVQDACQPKADRTILQIVKGKFYAFVVKLTRPRNYEIRTPTCAVGVRGTEFSVEALKENGRPVTAIEVTEGAVWVRKNGETKEIVLHAGESGRF